jgi:membrane associated rhomboid family serine protease
MDERLDTTVCYRHPDRATRLRCSECNRPICVECSHDAAVGQKCPECAKPQGRYRVVQARNTVGRRAGFSAAPVTYTLMTISVAIFAIGFLSPDAELWLLRHFASINILIAQGEWWRVLTAAFLHGGITHILFNMYALYLFGPRLETQVGSVPFGLLYFASAAGGGAASYLFGPLDQIAVGASGAIFGLFGAWLYAAYKLRATPAGRSMFNQLGVLLLVNLALPLLIPNIDWRAHVGGLIAGAGVAALWGKFAVGRRDVLQRRSILAALVLVGLILLIILA